MAAMLAVVFLFSTGTAFAQHRGGGQVGGQHQVGGGNRGFENRGGNRGFENRGGNRGFENRGFDNRGNRGYENRGIENRGYDNRNYRGGDRDYRGYRGGDRDYRGYRGDRDYRDYRGYDRDYRGSRDWDRYDRYYDRDDYRLRFRGNWGYYGNRGGWRNGIWIGIPGDFNYEIVVYETVYDQDGSFSVRHVAYWSNYYGGYVWYDINGNLRVSY